MSEPDTTADTLPAPPPSRWRRRRRLYPVLWSLAAAATAVAAVLLVPAQWVGRAIPGHMIVDDGAVAFKPGGANTTIDRLKISGLEFFEPTGTILFTTVSIDDELTVAEWVQSWLSEGIELHTRESVFGDRTSKEQREYNLDLMAASVDTAVLVALDHLGIEMFDATGLSFDSTVEGAPADGTLDSGWVIVAVDGIPITSLNSLQDLLAGREPGTAAILTVEVDGTAQRRDVPITLGAHPDGDGGFIGIRGVRERLVRRQLPFDVDIESGAFSGPSAGLAFTLAIIDALTPGELTGGGTVAVTGTIAVDGSVGSVGGILQKAAAANRAGADLFIVPSWSGPEAVAGAGDTAVVGVASLAEALAALVAYGGDAVEPGLPP